MFATQPHRERDRLDVSVFELVAVFCSANPSRFVAEVEAIDV